MGSESTVYRIGDPKCRSNRGDDVLYVQGVVGNGEGVPRFRGSTDEFLANEGEVRAEDFEGNPPLLLPNSVQGVQPAHLRKIHDQTNTHFHNHASLHLVPQEIHRPR